ncbi:hypothetical protein MYX77_13535, partial [Acidobacteriia bacterium AH_259_A11_L15]|nr:hypothetical protein [Acidobacteriia bacterium AH_259_A11_L15]
QGVVPDTQLEVDGCRLSRRFGYEQSFKMPYRSSIFLAGTVSEPDGKTSEKRCIGSVVRRKRQLI